MGQGKDIEELRRAFFGGGDTPGGVFYATVKTVDKGKRTCAVEAEEMTYDDVSLYAVENDKLKGMCVVPASGSQVLVGRIGGSNELYVAMFSEIDGIVITIGDKLDIEIDASGIRLKADTTTMKAVAGGFTITRGNSGLKKTLGDLCDAIGAITVPTNMGPSGIPVNKAQFDTIKQDLNNYLEG